MIFTELAPPIGKGPRQCLADAGAHVELDAVALAVVETDGLDPVETIERPGETGGRILAAGKQYERARLIHHRLH